MRVHHLSFAALALLTMTACTPDQQQAIDSMMDDTENPAMTDDSGMMQDDMNPDDAMTDDNVMTDDSAGDDDTTGDAIVKQASYVAYSDDVLMNGETKVLFFHAAWCPVCRSANTELESWFAAGTPTRNVYKVDYDTSADLKAKYGVTYQHTFVLVDGQGNALQTVQGPSDAVLMGMIGVKS